MAQMDIIFFFFLRKLDLEKNNCKS